MAISANLMKYDIDTLCSGYLVILTQFSSIPSHQRKRNLTLYVLNLFRGNINIYLYFVSFHWRQSITVIFQMSTWKWKLSLQPRCIESSSLQMKTILFSNTSYLVTIHFVTFLNVCIVCLFMVMHPYRSEFSSIRKNAIALSIALDINILRKGRLQYNKHMGREPMGSDSPAKTEQIRLTTPI